MHTLHTTDLLVPPGFLTIAGNLHDNVSMHTTELQEKSGQVSKELIRPALCAIHRCRYPILPEKSFEDVLRRSLDVMFATTFKTRHQPDLVIGDGVEMHLASNFLSFEVRRCIYHFEIPTHTVLVQPSADLHGNF